MTQHLSNKLGSSWFIKHCHLVLTGTAVELEAGTNFPLGLVDSFGGLVNSFLTNLLCLSGFNCCLLATMSAALGWPLLG